MSAYTRIRPEGGLQRFVRRALRICRWMTTGSLVLISGGDGNYRHRLQKTSRQRGKLEAGARARSAGTHPQTLCKCPVRSQNRAGAALWEQQQKTIG